MKEMLKNKLDELIESYKKEIELIDSQLTDKNNLLAYNNYVLNIVPKLGLYALKPEDFGVKESVKEINDAIIQLDKKKSTIKAKISDAEKILGDLKGNESY